ncbi:MAG: Formyl-CoA transferase [Bacteroidota bacterium]|jgi:crotonobetainyl-CoA:carnitine CoA-transferase CaiB-like acyl-CoA transferase|nr:Formyl-CoA transferase [Bacteroidota bacterium]
MEDFFKDLKVIELASVLAGPAVGMFFSELGAEVVKIENKPNGGDVTRSWKLAGEDPSSDISAYYASVNWNKTSVFADLNNKDDRKEVLGLLANADILISNYKPGDDFKLGMDYESIKKINPGIIYAHITGFGPDVNRTAYDLVLQAETGFLFMNGSKESGPVKMPVALIDILAAHQLKEGILLALIKKMKTGKGSMVSVSLYDAAIASLANQASNWLMTGIDPQPMGSLHPNIAPYGEIFETGDQKKIILAVGNDKQFRNLCELLNVPYLTEDPSFISNPQRVKNRNMLYPLLNEAFKNFNSENLMEAFIRKDVPAGMIKSLKQVFSDPKTSDLINSSMLSGKRTLNVRTAVFKLK